MVQNSSNRLLGGFLFGMERFLKRQLDRRTAIQIGILTALGLSAAVLFGREKEAQKKGFLPGEIASSVEAKKNFTQTLQWMSKIKSPEIAKAVDFFRELQPELDNVESLKIGFTSTIQKEPAKVTTIQTPDGPKLRIILSLQKFANNGFNLEKAATSLFSVFIVYELAKDAPERFESDPPFRVILTEQATQETAFTFSSK